MTNAIILQDIYNSFPIKFFRDAFPKSLLVAMPLPIANQLSC